LQQPCCSCIHFAAPASSRFICSSLSSFYCLCCVVRSPRARGPHSSLCSAHPISALLFLRAAIHSVVLFMHPTVSWFTQLSICPEVIGMNHLSTYNIFQKPFHMSQLLCSTPSNHHAPLAVNMMSRSSVAVTCKRDTSRCDECRHIRSAGDNAIMKGRAAARTLHCSTGSSSPSTASFAATTTTHQDQ